MPEFKLIRSRRKTIGLYIDPGGELVVRAPLRTPLARLEEIVRQKAAWIARKQAEMRQRPAPAPAHRFAAGEQFLFLGQLYPLEINEKAKGLSFSGRFILGKTTPARARKLFTDWYLAQAARVFGERVSFYVLLGGFNIKQVRLSNARARWGSCSSTGSINLTWRLVMAPPAVIDYVIVHELAHTLEHNHSKAFWARVAAILPDYKVRQGWLKKNGSMLGF